MTLTLGLDKLRINVKKTKQINPKPNKTKDVVDCDFATPIKLKK